MILIIPSVVATVAATVRTAANKSNILICSVVDNQHISVIVSTWEQFIIRPSYSMLLYSLFPEGGSLQIAVNPSGIPRCLRPSSLLGQSTHARVSSLPRSQNRLSAYWADVVFSRWFFRRAHNFLSFLSVSIILIGNTVSSHVPLDVFFWSIISFRAYLYPLLMPLVFPFLFCCCCVLL